VKSLHSLPTAMYLRPSPFTQFEGDGAGYGHPQGRIPWDWEYLRSPQEGDLF